ncbi:MAG: exosortase/archaeosortase family protein [Armatimonadetes bacterium]|nr:exosortase/archaeosortase family protein [Armatimonadota bacterium]MDE2205684.1 exosortase/archaeosortase family protein [Armatimonadota bacterium]
MTDAAGRAATSLHHDPVPVPDAWVLARRLTDSPREQPAHPDALSGRSPGPRASQALLLGAFGGLMALAFLLAFLPFAPVWKSDPNLTFGPAVVAAAIVVAIIRRRSIAAVTQPHGAGLVVAGGAALLFVIGSLTDVDPACALGAALLAIGGCLWLFGWRSAAAASGPAAVAMFAVPWPSTLVALLANPLRGASVTGALLMTRLVGVKVLPAGILLTVLPAHAGGEPFRLIVADACDGYGSLLVLGAIATMVACFTPGSWFNRGLLIALALPLAVITNAVRLANVLVMSAYAGRAAAMRVHELEHPFLLLLVCLVLMGARSLLIRADRRRSGGPE